MGSRFYSLFPAKTGMQDRRPGFPLSSGMSGET
jgi:hypothetical protein